MSAARETYEREMSQAEAVADQVYAADDVYHQDDNISWSRKLQILAVNLDGGGLCDLVDITSMGDDELHALADLDGENTMHALEDHIYWSRP